MPLRLLVERSEVNVCLEDPCLEVDLIVSAHLVDFYQLWLGRLSYLDARRKGLVELSGPPALERAFSHLAAMEPDGEDGPARDRALGLSGSASRHRRSNDAHEPTCR